MIIVLDLLIHIGIVVCNVIGAALEEISAASHKR